MAAGVVNIPWYATVFRGDRFADALAEIAPVALRYGARDYTVYRAQDDPYRFFHFSTFENKLGFERFWYGEEFIAWRSDYSSWYQVPVVPSWATVVSAGRVGGDTVAVPSMDAGG